MGARKKTGGRKVGTPNKTTKEIRDSYQLFVESNIDKFQDWIDKVAEINPIKAMELVISLSEYIIPKLSRTELKAEIEAKSDIDVKILSDEDLRTMTKIAEKYKKINK